MLFSPVVDEFFTNPLLMNFWDRHSICCPREILKVDGGGDDDDDDDDGNCMKLICTTLRVDDTTRHESLCL